MEHKHFLSVLALVLFPVAAMAGLNETLQYIYTNLVAMGAMAVVIIEVLLRIFKTKDPQSLLIYVAAACKLLANIFLQLGSILDKVVPQRVKDESLKIDEKQP